MPAERAKTRLIVPLTQATLEQMRAGMLAAASAGADMVELRLDFLDRPEASAVAALLADRPVPAIVTCRPVRQGGRFAGSETDRLEVLAAAARAGADYVDVEDDVAESNRPGGNVILSHHDFRGRPADLDGLQARLEDPAVAVAKIAFAAAGPEDAVAACRLLRQARKCTIALAMGEHGAMSRLLAGKFGAFGTFAALAAGDESAPGQFTLEEMKRLYRWDAVGAETAVYGVIGCPVAHSMSPALHNAAFAAAGIDAVYVPLRVEPGAENLRRFTDALRQSPWLDLKGLSVTIPHKQSAIAVVGGERVDELSLRIGAINTVRIEPDGSLRGWNTDYAGATDALCAAMGITRERLAGRAVAVIGAGGAARAIVAALTHHRADVTVYNRTVSRGEKLAAEFGARAAGLGDLGGLAAEVLINCTAVGMHPDVSTSPVPAEVLRRVSVVFDTVYNPIETRLLGEAAEAGCRTVSGVDMFVNQAAAQFRIWTGQQAPRELMRRVVVQQLQAT